MNNQANLNPNKYEKMKYKLLKISFLILIGLGITGMHAQESVNTAGGKAIGSGGSASYSIGQIFYTTNTEESGSVSQGVQQPFEISALDVEEFEGLNTSINIYPNPVTNYLTLEINDFEFSSLIFQLYDIYGRLLQIQKITDKKSTVSLQDLPVATYFAEIIEGDKQIKTFKIIKN